jgi:hypothetical protein
VSAAARHWATSPSFHSRPFFLALVRGTGVVRCVGCVFWGWGWGVSVVFQRGALARWRRRPAGVESAGIDSPTLLRLLFGILAAGPRRAAVCARLRARYWGGGGGRTKGARARRERGSRRLLLLYRRCVSLCLLLERQGRARTCCVSMPIGTDWFGCDVCECVGWGLRGVAVRGRKRGARRRPKPAGLRVRMPAAAADETNRPAAPPTQRFTPLKPHLHAVILSISQYRIDHQAFRVSNQSPRARGFGGARPPGRSRHSRPTR